MPRRVASKPISSMAPSPNLIGEFSITKTVSVGRVTPFIRPPVGDEGTGGRPRGRRGGHYSVGMTSTRVACCLGAAACAMFGPPKGGRPMTLFAWIVLSLLLLARPVAAQPTQLTIVQPAEATTMDPGRSTQVLTVNYFYNLYDSLTRWDAALRLQPGLATSRQAANDITWEFTLRPGVTFHDGSPLTAEDVPATIERNLVPGQTVATAGFTTIESAQTASPTLARLLTREPEPPLPARLAPMGSQILPAPFTT